MATIGGYPVRKLLRNSCLSALTAVTCAYSYKRLKTKPEKLKKVFAYSCVAGGTGMLLGLSFGWYRKDPNMFTKGLNGGVNFFLLTGCYTGVREAIIISDGLQFETRGKRVSVYQTSAASGAITGFLAGVFWWTKVIPIFSTTVAFCTLAATGQFVVDRFNIWKTKEAIRRNYPELKELEWQLLDEGEKQKIRKKQQGILPWILEILQDRPYSGKLALKIEALEEELVKLDEEEQRLNEKLNRVDATSESSNVTVMDSR